MERIFPRQNHFGKGDLAYGRLNASNLERPGIELSDMKWGDTVLLNHATIELIGGSYQLTDLNTTNFTRVNGMFPFRQAL